MPATSKPISGILNINKPRGITSHDVVARIRKLAGQRKVGHAGTLDPMATGVLLVCLGQATRLIEYLVAGRKQYRAVIRFGVTTNTLDTEGEIISVNDTAGLTPEQIRQILPGFLGQIDQRPPMFSAIKKGGRPLYKLARAGQQIDIAPRQVTIYALDWVAWDPPDLTLDVVCSPGTYIRSLARDLGEAAGVGAHLARLTRTASGDWSLTEAVALDDLVAEVSQNTAAWEKYLHPTDRAVTHLPAVMLDEETAQRVQHGQQVNISAANHAGEQIRAYTPHGDFLAILTRVQADDTLWQPKKVFLQNNKMAR